MMVRVATGVAKYTTIYLCTNGGSPTRYLRDAAIDFPRTDASSADLALKHRYGTYPH